jgi:hypothetical protein
VAADAASDHDVPRIRSRALQFNRQLTVGVGDDRSQRVVGICSRRRFHQLVTSLGEAGEMDRGVLGFDPGLEPNDPGLAPYFGGRGNDQARFRFIGLSRDVLLSAPTSMAARHLDQCEKLLWHASPDSVLGRGFVAQPVSTGSPVVSATLRWHDE